MLALGGSNGGEKWPAREMQTGWFWHLPPRLPSRLPSRLLHRLLSLLLPRRFGRGILTKSPSEVSHLGCFAEVNFNSGGRNIEEFVNLASETIPLRKDPQPR